MLRSRKISFVAILALCVILLSACYPNGRPFASIDETDLITINDVRKGGGVYTIKDQTQIKAFIDMLNGCTYEKFDDDDDTDTVFKQRKYYRISIEDQVFYINDEVSEIYINPIVNSGREGRYKIVDFNKDIFDALLAAAEVTAPPAQ